MKQFIMEISECGNVRTLKEKYTDLGDEFAFMNELLDLMYEMEKNFKREGAQKPGYCIGSLDKYPLYPNMNGNFLPRNSDNFIDVKRVCDRSIEIMEYMKEKFKENCLHKKIIKVTVYNVKNNSTFATIINNAVESVMIEKQKEMTKMKE